MTANHLLLYRIAELMLAEQQHQLPVDLLFEDRQIGEFVKSIQIDSPYQQMLLEGVLTETVNEDKLYVTFTAEGYFHYVLGEVIFNQAEGKVSEFLKDIIENNKLNGAQEGVEQCLIRDVENDDLSRLMWLIDGGGASLDACSMPLAHAFLQVRGNPKSDEELKKISKEQIKRVMDELLADPTDNDIKVLTQAIKNIEHAQKNQYVTAVYSQLNKSIKPDNLTKAKLYAQAIKHFPPRERSEKLKLLSFYLDQGSFHPDGTLLLFLAGTYSEINDHILAKKYYLESIKQFKSQYKNPSDLIGVVNINLASLYHTLGDYKNALDYSEKALKITDIMLRLKVRGNLAVINKDMGDYRLALKLNEDVIREKLLLLGEQHPDTAISYNNISLVLSTLQNYDQAILFCNKAIEIRKKIFGENHILLAQSFSNLASVITKKGLYSEAMELLNKALNVHRLNNVSNSETATIYNNIGSVYSKLGDAIEAIRYTSSAYSIFKELYGSNHPSSLFVKQKLKDLNEGQ